MDPLMMIKSGDLHFSIQWQIYIVTYASCIIQEKSWNILCIKKNKRQKQIYITN